jgi:hypothetical protein
MSQRHATDVISLVFGVIFAGFTAVWLLHATDAIEDDQAWLTGPIVLMAAGAVGLAAALRPRRAQPVDETSPWVSDANEDDLRLR